MAASVGSPVSLDSHGASLGRGRIVRSNFQEWKESREVPLSVTYCQQVCGDLLPQHQEINTGFSPDIPLKTSVLSCSSDPLHSDCITPRVDQHSVDSVPGNAVLSFLGLCSLILHLVRKISTHIDTQQYVCYKICTEYHPWDGVQSARSECPALPWTPEAPHRPPCCVVRSSV